MQSVVEGPLKIGKATVEAAFKRRAKGVRLTIRDSICPRLALVVNPKGVVWRFEWRPRGVNPNTGARWPSQAITLGTPESLSPDAARAAAGKLRGEAKAGADLSAERRQRQAEANRARASTVSLLADDYERVLPGRPKLRGTGPISGESAKKELEHLRRSIAAMGVADQPVREITHLDVQRMLTAEAKRPATARKHYGAVSRFFDWCVEQQYLEINPCVRMPKGKRPRPVPSRPNCPPLGHLAAIWHGAGREWTRAAPQSSRVLPDAERDLARWLVLVPCRLREATRLDWSHLDLKAARWEMPGALTKTREPHRLHLHPPALALLSTRHEAAGKPTAGLVFPSVRRGKPIEGFSVLKAHLSAVTGLADWTFHDFRRSFASACAELGVAEPVADAILSHKQAATRGGVLGVYQRATRWPEQVSAMNAWGAALESALNEGNQATP